MYSEFFQILIFADQIFKVKCIYDENNKQENSKN